jgi:hypothetical protein
LLAFSAASRCAARSIVSPSSTTTVHHPVEIRATLAAAKAGFDCRVVTVFQPHRYTRTRLLFDEFLTAFNQADVLIVMDIYGAGETPIDGVGGAELAEGIRAHGHRNVLYLGGDRARIVDHVSRIARPGGHRPDARRRGREPARTRDPSSARNRFAGTEAAMLGEIRGEVRFKEPLSFHTSLRIGGPADIFIVPQDVEDIRHALMFAEREQLPVADRRRRQQPARARPRRARRGPQARGAASVAPSSTARRRWPAPACRCRR